MRTKFQRFCSLMLAGALALSLISGAVPKASAAEADSTSISGEFQFDPHEGGPGVGDLTDSFIYSDDYFKASSYEANEHLATMSMQLAAASISSKSYNRADDAYVTRSRNVTKLLTDLKFTDVQVNENYNKKMGEDTMGVAVAYKNLDENTVLLAIVPRSAGYESEWSGNFNVGTESDGLHAGFRTARNIALNFAKDYVTDESRKSAFENKTVKVWTVGYSRGAATANLIGAAIADGSYNLGVTVQTQNVYAYTFGTPATVQTADGKKPSDAKYNGIHNYYSDYDPVMMMPFSTWGFTRYGQDHTLNSSTQKTRMLRYLQELNPTVYNCYTQKGGDPDNFTAMRFDAQTQTIQPDTSKSLTQKAFFTDRINYLTKYRVTDRDTYVNDRYQDMLRTLMVLNFGGDGYDITRLAGALQSNDYRDEATGAAEMVFAYSLMQTCAEQYGPTQMPDYSELEGLMEQFPALKEALKQKLGLQYDSQLLLVLCFSSYKELAAKTRTMAVDSVQALLEKCAPNLSLSTEGLTNRLTSKDTFAAPLVEFLSAFAFGVELTSDAEKQANSIAYLAQMQANTAATLYANSGSYMRVHNNEVILSWLRTQDSNYEERYTVTVNGQTIGKYKAGETVTINGTPNERFRTAFKSWSTADEDVKLDDDTSMVTTFTMPAKNVALTANYVSRIRNTTLTVAKPVAGEPLPTTGTLSWTRNHTEESKNVAVSWLEQVGRTSQPASGTAKPNTSYSVKVYVRPDPKTDFVFAFDIDENSEHICYTGDESQEPTLAFADGGGSLYLTGPAVTTGSGESLPATDTDTVTVTINGKDTGMTDSEGKHWSKTWQYTYTKGDKVIIDAPSEKDEQFEKWEWERVPEGVTGAETDTSLMVDSIQSNITLTAVYNPVVKELDLTIPEPKVGETLATGNIEAKATISNQYDVNEQINIEWLPVDSAAAYGTAYTAKLTLKPEADVKFSFAGDLALRVNGTTITGARDDETAAANDVTAMVAQEVDGYAIYVTFPKTAEATLDSVAQPNNVHISHSDAAEEKWALPRATTLTLSDGSRASADISWQSVETFVANNAEAQTLTATGIVMLPEDVQQNEIAAQTNELQTTSAKTVTAEVYVDAIEQVKMPTATLRSGSYTGAQTIYLNCETEGATIYYTLDGSTPSADNGAQYDGKAIALPNAAATELRAVAVRKNMTDSEAAIYRYTISAAATNGSTSGPAVKPTEEPKDYKNCDHGSDCVMHKLNDLDANAWYHDGIHYCLDSGLMSGYGDGRFGPNDSVSRAQLVTVLWRMAGSPKAAETANGFSDIASGTWYTDAVLWAAKNGVVTGYGDGRFAPNDAITREQLAAMLYRFAKLQGCDMSADEDTNILSYTDARSVSDWAMTAMQWACGAGLVNGANGSLMPQGTATRAQMAAILQRLSALSK